MERSQIAFLVTSFLLQVTVFISILKQRAAVLVLLQRGWRWIRDCAPRTGKDKKVSEGVQQFRFWVADRMLTYLGSVFGVAVVSVQFNILRNSANWISDGQMWIVLAALLACVIGKQIHLTSQGLDVLYLYFSFLSVAYVSEFVVSDQDFAYFSLTSAVFLRLPALFFGPRLPMVVLANLLSLLHAFWRVLREDFVAPCNAAEQDDHFAIRQEALMFFNIISFSWIMSRILQEKAELELERGNVASQLSAASSLLRLTCDAVIELDNDLRLTEDSPELAYMLMRSGPGATLKGANFLDFMVPSDALRAQDILGSEARPSDSSLAISPGRQIMARAFHTRLIDSYNTKICMEVFQVRYSKLDQKCYLLGLRDFTDVKPLAGDQSASADSLLEMDTSIQRSESLAASPGAAYDMDTSQFSGDSVIHVGSKATKEMYLDIDMEGLLIHSASSPLTHLAGKSLREVFPSPHTSLLMQSLHTEATSARGSIGRVLQYKDLPLTGTDSGVSGSMQLTKNRFDQIHVLMVFTEMRRRSEHRSRRLSRASMASTANIMIPASTMTAL